MLIPYRVKNPPKTFPYVTVGLIAINVIVYVFTTDYLLVITEGAINAGAFAFGVSSPLKFFSAVFLHAEPFHLLGNMLFLWVFGPPVESRLGAVKFLAIYFLTGLMGSMLQSLLDTAFHGAPVMGIGASGCIMGIIGAYWYIYTWSTVCVAYFFWFTMLFVRWGVWEVAAIWIIGIYFLMDLFDGLVLGAFGSSGGVANLCHVGGAATGVLICAIARVKRDSQELSDAKALHSDMKNLSMVPLHALETMSEEDPENPEIIRAMLTPSINMNRPMVVHDAMKRAGASIVDKDPGLVGHYLTALGGDHSIYKPVHLMRVCTAMERAGQIQQALAIYQIIVNAYPTLPDAETSLYRMAHCCWNNLHDRQKTELCLAELGRRFPNGPMSQFARNLQREMSSG